ncbi:MAG: hypothetical protein WEA10_03220 [Actinomycetota bacterium]
MVAVRERTLFYVKLDDGRWRLSDEEGGFFGRFGSLESAVTAARFLARQAAPSAILGQDASGAWEVYESFEHEAPAADRPDDRSNGRSTA